MKRLPLYVSKPLPAVQTVRPNAPDHNCEACKLSQINKPGERCISPDGEVGDVLVLGESPYESEAKQGASFTGGPYRMVRAMLQKIAPDRKFVFAYGIGCRTGKVKTDDLGEAAEACRPYLHNTLIEADPKIVLLLGPVAALAFLGRSYVPLSVRTGYSWFFHGEERRPVFFLPVPGMAMNNKLIRRALEADIAHALSGPQLHDGTQGTYSVIETLQDAYEAFQTLQQAPFVATDVETSGMMHEPDFRVECLATSDGSETYVWPRETIDDPAFASVLGRVLSSLEHTTWNGQYDLCAIETESKLGKLQHHGSRWVLNLQSDARIKRKLYEADAKGDLATAAELVGMGGHKAEAHDLVDAINAELKKLALSRKLTPSGKPRKTPDLVHIGTAHVPPVWLDYLDQGFEPAKFSHRYVPKDIEHRYCARDAYTTWHLEDWANQKLVEDEGFLMIWEEVIKPAMWAWCSARLTGFPTDKSRVELLAQLIKVDLDKVQEKIEGIEPGLNPASSQQVFKALDKRGLLKGVKVRQTDGGAPSMDKDLLKSISGKHQLIDLLLTHRLLKHTDDNFVTGMLPYIRSDGRIHPSYLQDGTGTGRPSSSDPNMFNRLKGRDEASRKWGGLLRECHIMPQGWTLLEADEGQIEIRKLMDHCEDPTGIAAIKSGMDFHMHSARLFATAMGKDPKAVTDLDREAAKTCIAEGELVLTDTGLVPIENLAQYHKVWDGVEWVQHAGVVCRGIKKVICYDGLTATPDHRVYTPDGDLVALEVAALDGSIATGGNGEVPVGYTHNDWANRPRWASERASSGVCVLPLWHHTPSVPVQCGDAQDHQLPVQSDLHGQAHPTTTGSLVRNELSMQQPRHGVFQELWSARDRMPVCFMPRVCGVGAGAPSAPDVQTGGHRPHRQQRTLRAWESPSDLPTGESLQQANNALPCVPWDSCCAGPCLAPDENGQSRLPIRERLHCQAATTWGAPRHASSRCETGRWAQVYDVVNAGPRHRFTVSGKIVANCNFAAAYELPEQLGFMLSKRLKISVKEGDAIATALFGSYKKLQPWMMERLATGIANGYSITLWRGKPARRRPLWHLGLAKPARGDRDNPDTGLWQNHARSTYNGEIQGSSVDIVTSMLWPLQCWLDANTDGGSFVLQIYDSIMVIVRDADVSKTLAYLKELMTDTIPGKRVGYMKEVPLAVDMKYGKSWGTMKKVAP